MKIGMTTFGGDGGKSGISQYIIRLVRELAVNEVAPETEVLVYRNERDIFVPNAERLSPILFPEYLRSPVVNVAWHQAFLSGLCRKREYDVLFLPAGNRRLPYTAPCPTVGAVHDLSSLHVEGKYDPFRMFYITKVLPTLVRRLTHVITISESSKRDILEYCRVPEERISVTPLAADTSLYSPGDRDEARRNVAEKYGVTHPYIFFVSRIEHPGKNHARLIRAFAQLKEKQRIPHQLVLAGSDWDRASAVHETALQSGFSDDIVFTGFTPTADLPDLYRGADIFVFPSLYEGFGLPVLEAMSCGVPVACSNLSSMPEVIGEAGVQFDPLDEEAIAEALGTLLVDEALKRRYAEMGLARSRKFSWSLTAARTLEVLQAAANGETVPAWDNWAIEKTEKTETDSLS